MTYDEAMEALPQEPNEIATYLLDKGCMGPRKHGRACPIANYLRKETGILIGRVGHNGVIRSSDIQCMDFICPPHVTKFIQNFDNGGYDFLQGEPA